MDNATIDLGRTAPAIHNGYLTITNPVTGNHRTFRIRTQPADARFAPGERVVGLLTGPDNTEDYQGFGFVQPDGSIRVWRSKRGDGAPSEWERFADLIARRVEYEGRLVYQESRRCLRCNRELTDPTSIELGIGPVCRGEE